MVGKGRKRRVGFGGGERGCGGRDQVMCTTEKLGEVSSFSPPKSLVADDCSAQASHVSPLEVHSSTIQVRSRFICHCS